MALDFFGKKHGVQLAIAIETSRLAKLFHCLEAAGISVNVVGELPDVDPPGPTVSFAPLPLEPRSHEQETVETLVAGEVVVNLRHRTAYHAGRSLDLGRREYELLVCFARHPNRVLSKQALRTMVWGDEIVSLNAVEVHVSALRRKFEHPQESGTGQILHTVRGAGYVLRQNVAFSEGERDRTDTVSTR